MREVQMQALSTSGNVPTAFRGTKLFTVISKATPSISQKHSAALCCGLSFPFHKQGFIINE
jgi:hypothetical protein